MLAKKLLDQINKIFINELPKKVAVGVSGGVDSMALVFLLQDLFKDKQVDIIAIVIDHKYRKESTKQSQHIKDQLEKHDICCHVLNSYLDKEVTSNIEASLREVRYNLLSNFCKSNDIKHLFIGHHKQDLAENFLIRLFRGSGIDGLAATDYVANFKDTAIVRPLLDFSKDDLESYVLKRKITITYDESNDDDKFLRNKIRKFLESLDDKDSINNRIALASRSILENKKIVNNYLVKNSANILEFNDFGYYKLNLDNFRLLSSEENNKYLSWMLMDVGGNFYKPRLSQLENLKDWILSEKGEKKRSFYGCIVEKYLNNHVLIYREKSKISQNYDIKNSSSFVWDNRFKIKLLQKLDNVVVRNMNATEFNKLKIKHNFDSTLKNIIYTLPAIAINDKIVAIPHLKYCKSDEFSQICNIEFDKKTNL